MVVELSPTSSAITTSRGELGCRAFPARREKTVTHCGRDACAPENCRRDACATGLLSAEEKVSHVRDRALGRGDTDALQRPVGQGLQPPRVIGKAPLQTPKKALYGFQAGRRV